MNVIDSKNESGIDAENRFPLFRIPLVRPSPVGAPHRRKSEASIGKRRRSVSGVGAA
ncbi:hypothetical protein [Bosea sp. FBZP-16]|uniref:hypothetical protein n=1 Tax=Bosea sp. FBZP-16 TaxID=2065382 RepID=UPI00131A02BC|nr:hypothetical protein [Bosea sp. FBZP-16]